MEVQEQEDSRHAYFMKQALLMGERALEHGETPVGCVLVHHDKIVGAGMNDTNKSMNVRRGSWTETSTLGTSSFFSILLIQCTLQVILLLREYCWTSACFTSSFQLL